MFGLLKIDVPVGCSRGVILAVIVADGNLIEIQPVQILQIIVA